MKRISSLYFLWNIFLPIQMQAVSEVYNFRIAQITKQPIFPEDHRHHSLIALPFVVFYKKHSGDTERFAGGLGSYIFDREHFYMRFDAAGASIKTKSDGIVTFAGAAADDVLLTVGYNIKFPRHHTTATFSGLVGIPTHRTQELQHADFGYGQASLGLQVDGLYDFNHISSFIYGTRYIYFIPRTAFDLNHQKHTFTIGNISDTLVAIKNVWQQHGFELGYTARFDFGAHCKPLFDDIVKKTNYIRSNFYAVYKYKFIVHDVANRLLLNFGYSFDHTPKYFGNKYILTLWASWQINF